MSHHTCSKAQGVAVGSTGRQGTVQYASSPWKGTKLRSEAQGLEPDHLFHPALPLTRLPVTRVLA